MGSWKWMCALAVFVAMVVTYSIPTISMDAAGPATNTISAATMTATVPAPATIARDDSATAAPSPVVHAILMNDGALEVVPLVIAPMRASAAAATKTTSTYTSAARAAMQATSSVRRTNFARVMRT
jgi:hypothetical protein